jgi:protein-disulfide isomerase
VTEAAVKAVPRRGRLRVIAILAVSLLALGYIVVELSTQKAGRQVIEISGLSDMQRTFGGIPQEGDRLGSSNAPVTIQVFNDLQCSNCRDDYLETIPALAEHYARPGDVKLLWRHYSNSMNPANLGFYGAEAAAEEGYAWQYIYLFFVNQDEAGRFGVDEEFLDTVAGSLGEMDQAKWREVLDDASGKDGPIERRLEGYEELARGLGIRLGQGMIVTGPNGSRTLQEGPSLAEVERAIAEVE